MTYLKKTFYPAAAWILSCLVIVQACQPSAENRDAAAQDSDHSASVPTVSLSRAQMRTVGIRTGRLELRNMQAVVRASGQLAVPPQNRADVHVPIPAFLKEIRVLEGQAVRKGEVLVWAESPEVIQLQQEYLTRKRSFAFTREELNRQRQLHQASAGRGKDLERTQAAFASERARILGMEKRLEQLGMDPAGISEERLRTQVAVTAPITGTIGHIFVHTGTYADTEIPLMDIVDHRKVHADLIVFEKDLVKVKVAQTVHLRLSGQPDALITGKIYGINQSFEPDVRGMMVHVSIANPESLSLIPGMFVNAVIEVDTERVWAVPAGAIVRMGGRPHVFGVDSTDDKEGQVRFRPVEVATGIQALGWVAVRPVKDFFSELSVVTSGAYYLLSEIHAETAED